MADKMFDVIVIGAGHNGLTAANYLAMGGLKVCVLEQRHIVGGAVVTEEFHPGYRNSIASYVVGLLRPEVVDELGLANYGYQTLPLVHSFYPDSNGEYLLLTDDEANNRKQYEKFSETDYDNHLAFKQVVEKLGEVLSSQWLREPPKIQGGNLADLINSAKLGFDLYKLDEDTRWRFLQFFVGAPETIIETWFDSDKVKAMMAASCMASNYVSLQHPGAGLPMLREATTKNEGKVMSWGLVKGGMGAITQAMAASAHDKGVVIRTQASVEKIQVKDGVVTGVQLATGESIRARIIAANTDPNRTFLKLLGEQHLPESFARDIKAFRQESASLRLNLALSGLPEFSCLPGKSMGDHHCGSIVFIESKDHLEQAYRSSRAGVPADPPVIDALIPSTVDNSLTDQPGTHVMSLLCKYMPYDLADGRTWDDIKEETTQSILDYVTTFIPNLPDILVAHQCFTPLDLERVFGMTRGDISHGRMEPDQLFSTRPHPKAAQYSTPVNGLYLCGSGSHPGGGVTGAPGRNAAKRILRDL